MTIYYTENEKDFSLLMQKLEERGFVHAPTNVSPTQVSFSDFSLANNCVRVDNNEKVFHVAAKEYYEANFPQETIINFKQEEEKKCRIYHTETQADYDALMIELEAEGITWPNGQSLTKESAPYWNTLGNRTCIRVTGDIAFRALKYFYEKRYSSIPIIRYKEKADESMKIYHTETQADYDALMTERVSQGCKWTSGDEPSQINAWKFYKNKTCIMLDGDIIRHSSLDYYQVEYPTVTIIKYKAEEDESLMKSTKETSVVKEVIAYQINTKTIRVNSVIQYREKGKDWVRGLVNFVDKYSINVRSYGTNHPFSSTSIGSGNIEIKVEIY